MNLLPITADTPCPCGSGLAYGACCQPFHRGALPPTPEALMRSRYSAYFLCLEKYLLASWHPSTRPADLSLEHSPRWVSLDVISTDQNGDTGTVYFRATCRMDEGWHRLEEDSTFVREAGRWFYLTGKAAWTVLKPGRNDRCPCGSGRKFKACCMD